MVYSFVDIPHWDQSGRGGSDIPIKTAIMKNVYNVK